MNATAENQRVGGASECATLSSTVITTPPCAVRDVIRADIGRCDLALELDSDIGEQGLKAGDILLTNKTVAPKASDRIVLLLRDSNRLEVVGYEGWLRMKSTGRVRLSTILLGYLRRVS